MKGIPESFDFNNVKTHLRVVSRGQINHSMSGRYSLMEMILPDRCPKEADGLLAGYYNIIVSRIVSMKEYLPDIQKFICLLETDLR